IAMSAYGTVNYTGLEPITNSGTASDVELNLPASSDNATLADGGPGSLLFSSSPSTFEATTFTAPTHSLKIVGGSGDTLTINKAVDVSGGGAGNFITLNVPTVNLNANLTAATVSGNAGIVNVDDAPTGQIQDGIDVAASGATVTVAAGSYSGTVTINKTLTLRGANAGIAGNGARGAETIVAAAASTPALIEVSAAGATIDGFKIDGGNLSSAADNMRAIRVNEVNDVTVQNNVITGAVRGIQYNGNVSTGNTGGVVQHNLIQNLTINPNGSYGELAFNSSYVAV